MSLEISESSKDTQSATQDWMSVVQRKIAELRYGSVQITVHDGRVTLIESLERTRFSSELNPDSKAR